MKPNLSLKNAPLTWFAVAVVAASLTLAGCNKTAEQAEVPQGADPAQANLASADTGQDRAASGEPVQHAAPLSSTREAAPGYRARVASPQAAPPVQSYQAPPQNFQSAPEPYTPQQNQLYPDQGQQNRSYQTQPYQGRYDQNQAYPVQQADLYEDYATDEQPIEAQQPPPPLPQYSQPQCPGENYLWTPGYWGYAPAGYYWVPGAWVVAPYVGALWTPPYWGYAGSRYRWHHGFWGSHIGFYGGINYGFGYFGRGYEGGYWDRDRRIFNYNRTVNNVNTTVIHNVYNYRVVFNNTTINNTRISYNGGRGGLAYRPSPQELAVLHEQRIAPVTAQVQHMRQAEEDRSQFANMNRGRPPMLVAQLPLATAYRAPAAHPSVAPEARPIPPLNGRQQYAQPADAAQPANHPGMQVAHGNQGYAPQQREERPTTSGPQPGIPEPNRRPAQGRSVEQPAAQRPMPDTRAEQAQEQREQEMRVQEQQQKPARQQKQREQQQRVQQQVQPQQQQRQQQEQQMQQQQRVQMQEQQRTQRVQQQEQQQRVQQQQQEQQRQQQIQEQQRMEQQRQRPQPEQRAPAPQPRAEPAPQPHVESRPQPHQEPAPAPKAQSQPAQTHPDEHGHH